MDPLSAFRAQLMTAVATTLDDWGVEATLPLENPPDRAMGDAGIPCFTLAKALRKAPAAIAQDLAAAIPVGDWVAQVDAVGPYVNVFMDRHRLAATILADPAAALTAQPKPGKVLLEHTSANPNGPLHVGRARNPILGDTLARILRASGRDVETQYYMDNLGRQVAQLYYGKKNIDPSTLEPALRDKPDHDLVRYYQAANEARERDPAVAEEIKQLVATLETAPPELLDDVRTVYEACFEGMRQSLSRLGVTYDSIKDESDLVMGGDVEETIERLKSSPRWSQEEDGANYLDMEAELKGNKSTKFFFTRKDQTSVYATRDVAYHKWKAEQVASHGDQGYLVNVLGEDHRLQSLQVSVALEELGHPRPHVVFYAFVSLPEGKMSTRANRVVFLDDLLDEAVARAYEAVKERRGDTLDDAQLKQIAEQVGIAAIRFNIARVQAEKPIAFRWEEALDFEGGAPYLMYAHARAASLLRRAEGIEAKFDADQLEDGEISLAMTLAGFVPALEEAASADAPHKFCNHVLELAGAFNEYYRDHPVLECEDPAKQAMRLWCFQAAKEALRRGLEALGLPAPDVM